MEPNKGEIVMYQPDETIRLEVRMGEETVWLTQQQMAELFATDRSSIAKHIQNIYETEELEQEPTCAKIAQVRQEGKRKVKRNIVYYNLDMILSVGYRVNSKRGTKFRQWANKILKEYLLKGYVVNQRLLTLETQVAELQGKVDFFVRSSLPPVEGIFYDGQIFDAYAQIISLIKQAKRSIILIDNYISTDTLTMLSNRSASVSATIYTRQLSPQQQLDLQRHNLQYPPVAVNFCQRNHDRFLIIDDVVYLFGASLKDAGKKLFAYIRMQETSPTELLSNIR
ncbi:MAG: virulence RhuM family protein [Prevotella sp.]|nr:virulence RhuM family protein [Prevotella sp.]